MGAAEGEDHRATCVAESLAAGLRDATLALAGSGTAVYLANRNFVTFRTRLGVSGKTALVVSPMFFMFFLTSELTMAECSRRRHNFLPQHD